MPDAHDYDVVVIGAGIAGAALAAALSGHGLHIALVEAAPLAGRELPTSHDLGAFDARVSALTPRSRERWLTGTEHTPPPARNTNAGRKRCI